MQPILVILDPILDAPQPALEKAARLAVAHGAPLAIYVNAYRAAALRKMGMDDEALVAATERVLDAWKARITELLDQLQAPDAESHLFWEGDDENTLAQLLLKLSPSMAIMHTDKMPGLERLAFSPRHWALIRKAPCPVLCVSPNPWPDKLQVTVAVDTEHSRGKPESLDNRLLDAGRALARQLDAPIKIANVVEYPDETLVMLAGDALPVSLSNTDALRQFYQGRLDEFCKETHFPEEDAVLPEGAPHKALASDIGDHPGILVLGTVARGLVRRLLLGSTSETLLQHSETDVLIIKPADFASPWQQS